MEYIPDTATSLNIVLSVGTAFIIGKYAGSRLSLAPYPVILVQIALVVPLFYAFKTLAGYIFPTTTGSSQPSVSTTPNITMFPNKPLPIPTNLGHNSHPIVPSKGGTTATPSFGTSFLMTINTTVVNPRPESPEQLDYAPLIDFVAGDKGSHVLTFGYMPEGNLMQAIMYEGGSGDSRDIPSGDAYDTRITIGTPPVRKSFAVFLRTRPASHGYTTVEVYVNGVLGKTTTVRSLFFGGAAGPILPRIGYNASKKTYPAVDAEVQSLMVWGNASSLTTKDIQALANQHMNTEHLSRHTDTTRCKQS